MKKIRFSLVAILLVGIFMFAGCTKSGNATLESSALLFDGIVAKYQAEENDNKYKVFNSEGQIDLYSIDSYRDSDVFNNIVNTENGESKFYLNTLKKDAEYQVLAHATSQLYLKWKNLNYTTEIPQEHITKLYEQIEKMNDYINDLYISKKALQTTANNFDYNVNSIPVKESLEVFLKNYLKFIENFFEISRAYERVYETVFPNQTVTMLRSGDMIKFVLSSEIYLAKYYYLKNIVLTNNYLTRFSFEKIFDTKTNDFVDNPYYDSNFSAFATICNQDALVGDVDLNDADKIHYFNVGIKKLQSLKTNIDNLEIAINQIKNKNDKNGEYQKFVDEMAVQIESYQNYLTNNIMI